MEITINDDGDVIKTLHKLRSYQLSLGRQPSFWHNGSSDLSVVGTSLLTPGVVFQWASTIKTSRKSD